MDKDLVTQIALAIDLELKLLTDGTMGLRPYMYKFADAIAAEVYRTIEPYQSKDQQDLTALRQKVQNLASENIKLRAAISNARECLDEVQSDQKI